MDATKKIYIASDHAGYDLKTNLLNWLPTVALGKEILDLGTNSADCCDYPVYANKLVTTLKQDLENSVGILICGSGVGMAIAANRHRKIRAANCWSEDIAKLAREHNDANILVLGARVISEETAKNIIKVFLNTNPLIERKYIRRNELLEAD